MRLIDSDEIRIKPEYMHDICGSVMIRVEDVARIITEMPIIEPQKWIPCSERLPEEKGEYLVTYHPCYWDNVQQDIKVGIDSFRGKTSWAKKKHRRVIAWQPLPECYRGDENVK